MTKKDKSNEYNSYGREGGKTALYADVLFLINFSMDFLTVYITSCVLQAKTSVVRTVLSASMGGIYGVAAVLLVENTFFSIVGTAVISLFMTMTAFGVSKNILLMLKQSGVMWGCASLLGGVMSILMSMGNPVYMQSHTTASYPVYFILTFIFVMLFLRFVVWKRNIKSAEVVLVIHGQTFAFSALADSGNLVRDPLGGCPVIITTRHVLGERITNELIKFSFIDSNGAEKYEKNMTVKVRIIPHKTLDGEGILYGFLPDKITVNGKEKNAVVALDQKGEKNGYGGYDGIIPMNLCD